MRPYWAILLFALVGCSSSESPRVPVYGRVTIRGTALHSGAISFTPDRQHGSDGPTQRADLAANGQFRVPKGGLCPGWYRVTVASLDVRLPVRLRDPDATGIVREVVGGRDNILNIELDSQLANR